MKKQEKDNKIKEILKGLIVIDRKILEAETALRELRTMRVLEQEEIRKIKGDSFCHIFDIDIAKARIMNEQ